MNTADLASRLREICGAPLPLPGAGHTAERHLRLFSVADQDVSLAKLAEAHWDAVAILAEAGRVPHEGALYGVWASEVPNRPLQVEGNTLSGEKAFCSGFGLVDRALVTLGGDNTLLLDVALHQDERITGDLAQWQPEAFRATNTGAVRFAKAQLEDDAVVGGPGFYLTRPGFWHGACGPAACWAGGAAGLLRFADASRRNDPHTKAHRAAMRSNIWAMQALLAEAGREIDVAPADGPAAHQRALMLRHQIELLADDLLRRFGRAYGPFPLALHPDASRRYHEVEIFKRQSHAERDLEALADLLTLTEEPSLA